MYELNILSQIMKAFGYGVHIIWIIITKHKGTSQSRIHMNHKRVINVYGLCWENTSIIDKYGVEIKEITLFCSILEPVNIPMPKLLGNRKRGIYYFGRKCHAFFLLRTPPAIVLSNLKSAVLKVVVLNQQSM
jgi:hypothetical protein